MTKKNQLVEKPVALLDLDGTVADFHGAMQRDLRRLMGPGEPELFEPEDEDKHPHIKARRELIKQSPNWWASLEPLPEGFRLVEMLRELKYHIQICSRGPKKNASAWMQKVMWVHQHISDAKITITSGEKALHYGRVLIDDWPAYVKPWLEARPRGTVIMPARSWNKDFQHERVIRYTGENDEEVYAALKAQKDRSTQ